MGTQMKGAAAGVLALGSHVPKLGVEFEECSLVARELPVEFWLTFHELAFTHIAYVSTFTPACAF